MAQRRNRKKQQPLYHPRYGLTWLGLGLLYLVSLLPTSWQLAIGRCLGQLGYKLLPRRRHIAHVNLKLCFPELSAPQRQHLLKKHFAAMGMGIIETGMAWWLSKKRFQQVESVIIGGEHLEQALQKGHGVILFSAHFTTLELAARIVGARYNIATIYRQQNNSLFNAFMERARKRNVASIIPRHDIRAIIKSLRHNHAVYYAADQDYGRKYSIFVPFFGVAAATITATTRLAKISNAAIIPVFHYREDDAARYRVVFQPALENFPSANLEQDLQRLNQIIATAIREKPEQYLWTHRRFKTRPAGEKYPY